MDIIFKKSEAETRFQGCIYKARKEDGAVVYRVLIGREGTECPSPQGEFLSNHAVSDFMTRPEIDGWLKGKVEKLIKNGKKVELDENLSYLIHRAVEELAVESPITV
jgi:hypothetical protein